MANRYFLNIGTAFNDTANWSASSGGAGGASIPTSADFVFWDANSGNCSFDVNVSILGYNTTGYTGVITQNAFTFTIGTSNALFAAGTFNGSASNITHSRRFIMTGGIFTSTSGTLQIGVSGSGYDLDITGGQFYHNNGLVKSVGSNHTAQRNLVGYPLYNFELSNCPTCGGGGDLYIDNDLTITSSSAPSGFKLKGNLTVVIGQPSVEFNGTGTQNCTVGASGKLGSIKINKASGTLNMLSNVIFLGFWKHVLGTINWNGYKATCITNYNGDNVWENAIFYDFEVQITSGVQIGTAGSPYTVLNDLTLNCGSGANSYPSVNVEKNVSILTSNAKCFGINFTGTVDQTLSNSTGSYDAPITVNKVSGKVSLLTNHTITGSTNDLNLNAGEFDQNGFNLVIPDALNLVAGIYNQGAGILDLARFIQTLGTFNEGLQGVICRGSTFSVGIGAVFNRNVSGGGIFANNSSAVALALTMNGSPISNISFSRLTFGLNLGSSLIVAGYFKKSSTSTAGSVSGTGFTVFIGGDFEQNNIYGSRTISTSPTWVLNGVVDQNIKAPVDNTLPSGTWKMDKPSGSVIQLSNIIIDNGIVGDNGLNDLYLVKGIWCTNEFNLTVDGTIIILSDAELQKTPLSIITGAIVGTVTNVSECGKKNSILALL